jgi:hypothetical protein
MRLAQSILLIAVFSLQALNAAESKRPELPFFDWNACPFEGCKYGRWIARNTIVLYDTWKRTRRQVAKLAEGDKVVAVTGVASPTSQEFFAWIAINHRMV